MGEKPQTQVVTAEELTDTAKAVDELYIHYRGLATALSATIITLSGGVFYWLRDSYTPMDRLAKLSFGLAIVASLTMQFFHVNGYMHQGRARYALMKFTFSQHLDFGWAGETGTEFRRATQSFDRLDWATRVALLFCFTGLVLAGVRFI